MKIFALLVLSLTGFMVSADASEKDYLCKGTDSFHREIAIKFDSWVDNRQSARADVTFEWADIGPRTYVDLFVSGGDSDTGGHDFSVSGGNWTLNFYVYSSKSEVQKVEARYVEGNVELMTLNCTPL